MRFTRYSEQLKMRVIGCEEKILEDFERESALLQYNNKFIETRYPQTSPRGSLSPAGSRNSTPRQTRHAEKSADSLNYRHVILQKKRTPVAY